MYTEELVYTDSEDGVLLPGVVIRPAAEPAKPVAVLYVHGFSISAFRPLVTNLGREIAARGYAFLAGNTRGSEIGSWLFRQDGQLMLGGAWWEQFDESPRDLAAWVDFAMSEGHQGVVLLGHSFGALRVVYYQAQRQDPRVLGLVVAAPALRPWAWGPSRRPSAERAALAEQMVAEGRGLDLLPWEQYGAPWGTTSAQTYLSWVRANLDVFGLETPNPAVAQVRCPIFACYGTEDQDTGTTADLEMIRRNASAAQVETRMFEGANHGFVGHEAVLAQALADWMRKLP